MKKVYLARVMCKNDDCYQFVTESFARDNPSLDVIELIEEDKEE